MVEKEKLNYVVKSVDMSEEMQREVIEISKSAVDTSKNDKEIAEKIKDEFRFLFLNKYYFF